MPHIFFEYSDNIIEQDFKPALQEIHNLLAEQLPTKLFSCKSRIIRHENFLIGNGDENNAFVNVAIDVLPGREKDLLKNIAENIIKILQIELRESLSKLDLQLSVSIKNLPAIYYKN
jgi:5-carboxymethyl-2-hydroxymuconate isomerase